MTEFAKLIDLLSSRNDKTVCEALNEYFGQEGVCELLDSDDERCKEFLETVSRTNKGLEWFLARISLVKQQKLSRKRERDEPSGESHSVVHRTEVGGDSSRSMSNNDLPSLQDEIGNVTEPADDLLRKCLRRDSE